MNLDISEFNLYLLSTYNSDNRCGIIKGRYYKIIDFYFYITNIDLMNNTQYCRINEIDMYIHLCGGIWKWDLYIKIDNKFYNVFITNSMIGDVLNNVLLIDGSMYFTTSKNCYIHIGAFKNVIKAHYGI